MHNCPLKCLKITETAATKRWWKLQTECHKEIHSKTRRTARHLAESPMRSERGWRPDPYLPIGPETWSVLLPYNADIHNCVVACIKMWRVQQINRGNQNQHKLTIGNLTTQQQSTDKNRYCYSLIFSDDKFCQTKEVENSLLFWFWQAPNSRSNTTTQWKFRSQACT